MTNPVRIGVVGARFGAQVHVPAFRADSRCEVVAICASSLEHAKRAAEQLHVPNAYGGARELLASDQVDAASFAVPPHLQPELVSIAARAGKHVFCEKPVAEDSPSAARALDAVEKARVVHAVDFIFPEIPAWRQARSLLDAGALGRLRHAAVSWKVETYAFANHVDSWKTRSTEGGGTLGNFVSHTFYYLEWFFGPIARIASRLSSSCEKGDARVDLWMEMESGCPVTVSVAADAFLGTGHRLEIYGEKGTLILENNTPDYVNGFKLSLGTRESRALAVQPAEQFPQADGRIGAAGSIVRRFVDAILSGPAVRPNLCDGVRVQNLIAKARAASRTGAWQAI